MEWTGSECTWVSGKSLKSSQWGGIRNSLVWQNFLIVKHGWEPGSHYRVWGGFFGREVVAILHLASPHRKKVVVPDNGVETAQVISISTELHLHKADTSVLLWTSSHLHWSPSSMGSFLQQFYQTLFSLKNGALDTTVLSTKLLLVIYYCWKFRFFWSRTLNPIKLEAGTRLSLGFHLNQVILWFSDSK